MYIYKKGNIRKIVKEKTVKKKKEQKSVKVLGAFSLPNVSPHPNDTLVFPLL